MSLKATLVSSVYPHPNRGVWLGMERLVEGLSEALVKNGVDVSVVTSYRLGGHKGFEELPSGVKLFRVRSLFDFKPFGILNLNTASFSSSTFGKYYKLLRDSDVVHVFGGSLVPVEPLKNLLPPILCFVPHFDFPKTLMELLYVPYGDFLFYLLCRFSDLVTAALPPDSPQLEEFMRFFHVSREKIRFLYEGVDSRKFNPRVDASEISDKFNGGNIVLYAGSIIPRKGLVYLVQAIPRVVEEIPDAKFVFVGGKPEQVANLRILAQQLGVEKHLFFEGFVSDADLPKYYKAADVLSCPSLREGYPLPCLEAMACGTPIIGTNLGTISEVVGDTGILVQERDSKGIAEGIIELLENPSLRQKLGEKAAKRVEANFTWARTAKHVTETYREAMELRKRVR